MTAPMHEPDDHDDVASPRLDDAQIAVLRPFATARHLRDGESLFQAGDRSGGFFVVLSGGVEIIDRSGDEPRTIARHGPREFTGDIDIMSRRRPVVSAVARGETEVLHVSSSDIRRIVGSRPALGEVLLRAFVARREALVASGFRGLRVIGSGASRATFRLREFLTRNHVPFTWVDLDAEPGVAALLDGFGIGEADTPVVAYGSLPLMQNPSVEALAEVLGVRRSLGEETYDLVVVGAGPAGLAAAVYGASEGLSTLVLDRHAPGGQAGTSTKIENYLGFPTGISGAELTSRALLQAQKFGALVSAPSAVVGLDLGGPLPLVALDGGQRVPARSVLVATGAEYRKLDVPGREDFDGLGVYYAATHIELMACQGADVVVVGGGNSAGQAAMFLAGHTRRVSVLLRGGDLYKRMSSYLADRVLATENVEVLYHTEVRRMHGEGRLEAVEVEDHRSGEVRTLKTPAVFTFIGVSPRTGWLPPEVQTDAKGFVLTGRAVEGTAGHEPALLTTSVPGVFAAGDVRAGSTKRVASAVGEGAMAVKLVHEHLALAAPTDGTA